ncbi:15468_t:CDS:2, partial [Racocetra persica]
MNTIIYVVNISRQNSSSHINIDSRISVVKESLRLCTILAGRSTPYVEFLVNLLDNDYNVNDVNDHDVDIVTEELHTKKVEQEDDGDVEQELYEIDDEVELYKNNEIEHKMLLWLWR